MYAPTLARFISRDPLPIDDSALLGGLPPNLYMYADNDPVMLTDPSGMAPKPKKPPAKVAKPILFKVCCTHTRTCTYYNTCPDTSGPETADCHLASGVKPTAHNLAIAASICCSKTKPSGNYNPLYYCSNWVTFARIGACGGSPTKIKKTVPKSGCGTEMVEFFDGLDKFANGAPGGGAIPSPTDLQLACGSLCDCWYGAHSAPTGFCKTTSFCAPILAEYGIPWP